MAFTDDLYEMDFAAWSEQMAGLLRDRRFEEIDVENIAEEIESLGKRDWREVRSRFVVLLMHLLKIRYQAERCSRSWVQTVDTQRSEVNDLLTDSPSLRRRVSGSLAGLYDEAVCDAIEETDLPSNVFPAQCPWTLDRILNVRFYPDAP